MASAKLIPTIITIEIPDHTPIHKTAKIVARRGNKAVMHQAGFSNAGQLAEALIEVERNIASQEIDALDGATAHRHGKNPETASTKSKPKTKPKTKLPKYASIEDAQPPGRPAQISD